jgi:hypothetical protein
LRLDAGQVHRILPASVRVQRQMTGVTYPPLRQQLFVALLTVLPQLQPPSALQPLRPQARK